jgi:hypothetical protein
MSEEDLVFLVVPRSELGDRLLGAHPAEAIPYWRTNVPRLSPRDALVFWERHSRRPFMIGVNEDEREELFNWATTYRRNLSPLSSWCHVLPLKELGRLSKSTRAEASLLGLEAAWAGAAIAEAMIKSRRGYDTISLPACLATDTFALGRMASLYGARTAISDVSAQLALIRGRVRKSLDSTSKAPSIATDVLLRLLPDAGPPTSAVQELLLESCRQLFHPTSDGLLSPNLIDEFAASFPKLTVLQRLDSLPAEERVRLLREFPLWISASNDDSRRQLLYFAAGVVISGIGGGERDLRLAEMFGPGHPDVLTWAVIVGSLGESIYWSDAFGGIGRLVARELARSFDVLEAPTADISADEFFVATANGSGQIRLRTAFRNVLSISLRPGVVVQLSLVEEDRSRPDDTVRMPVQTRAYSTVESSQIQSLAEQLFPYLRGMFLRAGFEPASTNRKRSSRGGKAPQLPLK